MICGQTRVPGVSVSQVARRYDVNANLVFSWLRDARFADADAADIARFLPVEIVAEAKAPVAAPAADSPIRKNGRRWREDCPAATARNEILRATQRLGRTIWKRWTGYHARSRVEAKMRCLKAFGERIASRDPDRQTAEIHIRIALMNRFNALGTPRSNAWPDPKGKRAYSSGADFCNNAGSLRKALQFLQLVYAHFPIILAPAVIRLLDNTDTPDRVQKGQTLPH